MFLSWICWWFVCTISRRHVCRSIRWFDSDALRSIQSHLLLLKVWLIILHFVFIIFHEVLLWWYVSVHIVAHHPLACFLHRQSCLSFVNWFVAYLTAAACFVHHDFAHLWLLRILVKLFLRWGVVHQLLLQGCVFQVRYFNVLSHICSWLAIFCRCSILWFPELWGVHSYKVLIKLRTLWN